MSANTRYLRQEPGGHLFVWTEALAKRKDMTEAASAAPANVPEETQEADAGDDAELTADAVRDIADKDALEALGRKHDIELDRRKSVKKLQDELIERLELK